MEQRPHDPVVASIHTALDRLESTRSHSAPQPTAEELHAETAQEEAADTIQEDQAGGTVQEEEDCFLSAIPFEEEEEAAATYEARPRACTRRQGRREAKKAARLAREQTPEVLIYTTHRCLVPYARGLSVSCPALAESRALAACLGWV